MMIDLFWSVGSFSVKGSSMVLQDVDVDVEVHVQR